MAKLTKNQKLAEKMGEVLLRNKTNLPDALQAASIVFYQAILQLLHHHKKADQYLIDWFYAEITGISQALANELQDNTEPPFDFSDPDDDDEDEGVIHFGP